MAVLVEMDMPEDCLHCSVRKCLMIDGIIFQMCGLCPDGIMSEAFFKAWDLRPGYRSPFCPIIREVNEEP